MLELTLGIESKNYFEDRLQLFTGSVGHLCSSGGWRFGLVPLQGLHFVFIGIELVVGQFYHAEQRLDIIDVTLSKGLCCHVL